MKKITFILAMFCLSLSISSQELDSWVDCPYFTDDDREILDTDFYEGVISFLENEYSGPKDDDYNTALTLMKKKPMVIKTSELQDFERVRSIQFSQYAVEAYPFFNCQFTWEEDYLYFLKTSGSQRRWGQILRQDSRHFALTGCWFAGGDEPTYYFDENLLTTGQLVQVAPDKLLMLFMENGGERYDLYEITK